MAQLTPIQLEDGTTIYVEATEGLDIPTVDSPENVVEKSLKSKGASPPERLRQQLIQHVNKPTPPPVSASSTPAH